jgi:hypothetical protein
MTWRGLAVLAATSLVVWGAAACRRPAPQSVQPATGLQEPAPPPESIVLFFVDAESRLQRESREVPALPSTEQARIRLVLEELLSGSRQGLSSAFPWPVTVRTVFVDKRGTAYVDLAPAPPPEAVAGTDTEAALVYATVNTVVANSHGIARVQLLFDGKQVDTLGHLDLSRPLVPQTGLVAP